MKECTKCKIEKILEDFPNCKRYKDGKYSWCKQCSKDHSNKYRLENPESYKASREKRKDAALAKAREWKRKNADKCKKNQEEYYRNHYEEILEKSRNWSQNISEEQKKEKREYYKKWSKTENAKKYNITRKAVFKAVQSGALVRNPKCQICDKECKTEAHHADYLKPLQVLWVCRSCHGIIHRKLSPS